MTLSLLTDDQLTTISNRLCDRIFAGCQCLRHERRYVIPSEETGLRLFRVARRITDEMHRRMYGTTDRAKTNNGDTVTLRETTLPDGSVQKRPGCIRPRKGDKHA